MILCEDALKPLEVSVVATAFRIVRLGKVAMSYRSVVFIILSSVPLDLMHRIFHRV